MARTAMLGRLATARRAFERQRPSELRLDAGKMFSQAYRLKLSTVLPAAEIAIMLAAEDMRELGLARARLGDLGDAAVQLRRAAALCDDSGLSDHGRIAGLAFQRAAEAFLAYRLGRHDEAVRSLEDAIIVCDHLADVFGDAIEFRRIHFARNILRVQCHGAPSERIVADTVDLLYYIGGDASRWPLAVGQGLGKPERLSAAQRGCAVDETIINLALAKVDIGAGRGFVPRIVHRQGFDGHLLASFEWCDAMMALGARDQRSFARHAINFFEHRNYDLVHAGQILDDAIAAQAASSGSSS
ncbi:hypothetical protein WP12_02810 [Sphingomonas sp. SRS2]|nr:hypothetical protein WP12_02810 [Sphingomonas sp. SRS2]